jgi:integrase
VRSRQKRRTNQRGAYTDHSPGQASSPGGRTGRPISNMAMAMTLRRMGRGELTVHGFRSTFRDRTGFPAEVAEMALAHTVADAVERAYRRGDLFAKRRQLMDAWARFCTATPAAGGKVVSFAAAN